MTELTSLGAQSLMKHLFGEVTFSPGLLQIAVTDASKNPLGSVANAPLSWTASSGGTVESATNDDSVVTGAGAAPGGTTYEGVGIRNSSGNLLMWEDSRTLGVGKTFNGPSGVTFPASGFSLSFNYDDGYVTDQGGALVMSAAAMQQLVATMLSGTDPASFTAVSPANSWTINLLNSSGTVLTSRAWDRTAGEATFGSAANCSYYTNPSDLVFPNATTSDTISEMAVMVNGVEYWRADLANVVPVTTTSAIKIPALTLRVGLKFIS